MRSPGQFCSLLAIMLIMRSVASGGQFSVKPVVGGTPADSGFSAGAEIVRNGLAGPINGRLKGVFSVKKYELMETAVEIPEIPPWLAFKVTGGYRNMPQEDLWGLGNQTSESQRTNYLLEDVDTTAALETFFRGFKTGVSAGYLKINTGPGRDDRFPSTPDSLQVSPAYKHVGVSFTY